MRVLYLYKYCRYLFVYHLHHQLGITCLLWLFVHTREGLNVHTCVFVLGGGGGLVVKGSCNEVMAGGGEGGVIQVQLIWVVKTQCHGSFH